MEHRPTIAYQPALDGVRALAVAAVLLFHAEVPGFSGGYLGVSVFFTLSGYLITSLLMNEHDRTGSIDLPAFYARRVRRLLPASVVCLVGIALITALSDVFDGVADLRREVIGAGLQVANWVFLAGEGSYQQLFADVGGARSPIEHFWSLSIEEQFYWVWPPTMVLVLGRVRSGRGRTVAVGAIAGGFAIAAPVIAAVWGADAAYWATPARIAEILIGAFLAIVLAGRRLPPAVRWLAPAALAGLAICVVAFPASGGPAYEGWLPVVALGSATLVLGLQVETPLRAALATAPLVWLGKISYGVYLYHWPVYVIADEARTGLDGWQLVAVRLLVTLAIAQASYSLLEQPIRRRRSVARRPTFVAGALATATAVVLALAIVPGADGDYWETDVATVEAAAIEVDDAPLAPLRLETVPAAPLEPPGATLPDPVTADTVTADTVTADPITPAPSPPGATVPVPTTPPSLPALSRPVRIVVAGDSTARATAAGLLYWAAANPDLAQVEEISELGCGFVRGGERRAGGWAPPPAECEQWLETELPQRVAELQPDVVMLMVTSWDVLDHRWEGTPELTPLDPEYARRIVDDYRAVTTGLLASGAGSFAWVEVPIPNVRWANLGTGQEDPARHAVVRGVIEQIAAEHPGEVGIVELGAWFEGEGLADDRDVRPDGVHFEPVAALDIAERFLGERLLRIALA